MSKHRFPRKIHIIGSVGSGKTTLAREMAMQLNTPHYELDNIIWERAPGMYGDLKRRGGKYWGPLSAESCGL